MKLGMEVGLGLGHIVLDGNPAPPTERGTELPPNFRPMCIVVKRSPISATGELFFPKVTITCIQFHSSNHLSKVYGSKLAELGRI